MMVSSPLEQHKAHHIQVNCQESVESKVMSHGENILSRGRGIKSKMKQTQELTDKIYELGSIKCADADSRNHERTPWHPTIKHPKWAMTKGQRQEIGSQWLEETTSNKEATALEAIPEGSEGNKDQTNT